MMRTGVIHPLQNRYGYCQETGRERPMIVIGQPGDKRAEGIQAARKRLSLAPARIISYQELLVNIELLNCDETDGATAPLLRLESPGGSFEIERAFIALGAYDAAGEQDDSLNPLPEHPQLSRLSRAAALRLRELPGVLHHPHQWFKGYCRFLASLRKRAAEAMPAALWQNDPAEIALMTDKRRTQAVLRQAAIAVPRPIGGEKPPFDYDSLRAKMKGDRIQRAFIKLAYGSAASGVIAYQINPVTGAEIAITTIGVERYVTRPPIYYNSGKLKRYTDTKEIAAIVNWLYRHGAYAEQWIPKSRYGRHGFDIRQLVAGGEAGHAVARVSAEPMTNLHLRSERMSLQDVGLSLELQYEVRHIAQRTAEQFPASFSMGIDVLIAEGSGRCYIADVNPFGDLLYGVEHQGQTPYEWEMRLLYGKHAMDKAEARLER